MAINPYVNKVVYGEDTLIDLTSTTATAADVIRGKSFFSSSGEPTDGMMGSIITSTYDSANQKVTLISEGVLDTWFGGIQPEFLYETSCVLDLQDAYNWPLTVTTTAQNLTWKTTYTSTANANATFDRYGNGYHNGTALDYGVYNYIWLCDGFVKISYLEDEATMGTPHVLVNAFETVMQYGARPRTSNGAIIYPTASTYGAYGNTNTATLMCYYRNASNAIVLANNATYGVSLAAIAPSQQSTSSIKPTYFNFRYPTIGLRAHDTYMPVSVYSKVDWDKTRVNYRARLYRVPMEYGLYTLQYNRVVNNLILGGTFPAEPV